MRNFEHEYWEAQSHIDELYRIVEQLKELEKITKEEWDAILSWKVWPDIDDWKAWDILTDTLRAYAGRLTCA
jgi:hypothetical protein